MTNDLYKPRGKKVKRDDGYVLVNCPEYPFAKNGKYVFEHRLVMANYLGHPLSKDECVHHLNGIKDDNRIENFELTNNSSHRKKHWESASREERERVADIGRKYAVKIKIERKMIPCACGCGQMIENYTDHGRPKKYSQGHNQKGRHWNWGKNE